MDPVGSLGSVLNLGDLQVTLLTLVGASWIPGDGSWLMLLQNCSITMEHHHAITGTRHDQWQLSIAM